MMVTLEDFEEDKEIQVADLIGRNANNSLNLHDINFDKPTAEDAINLFNPETHELVCYPGDDKQVNNRMVVKQDSLVTTRQAEIVAFAASGLNLTTPAPSFNQFERRLGKQGPFLVPIRTTKSHALDANRKSTTAITMADLRRSPEGGRRKKGKETARAAYDEPPRMPSYEQPRIRPGAEQVVYSSSSSSSSSYIDISRKYPRFGLRAFFTAPSERRRLRRRRSTRLMRNGNSSSSSVNSDLAYGTGFIKRPRRRSVRARNGREIGSDRASDRENNRRPRGERREEAGRPALGRVQTEAEILAIGAGLAKLAKDQNRRDLRDGRNGGRPDLITGGSTIGLNGQGQSRGLVNSRPSHGSDTVDEEGWESASESEESVDSRLAFGEETKSSGGFFGLFGRKKGRPLSRKDSVVDPRLFGPQNTLHGIVTEPVGFGEVTPWSSINDFGQQFSQGPGIGPSHTGSQASLQRVYPVPTSDPGRFDARAASVISGPEPMVVSRPGPIPIQQPQPIAPISQSVYGRTESGSIPKRESTSSGRSKSLAEAALVGVAGAAVGAAIASSSRDGRKREDEDPNERNRPRRRESEKDNKYETAWEKRSSPDREERREKRGEKDDSSRVSSRVSSDKRREKRKEETREERDERRDRRRDEPRNEKDEKREKRREERRSERFDDRGEVRRTKSETAVPKTVIDPFQYQVADDAFPTPSAEPSQRTVEPAPAVHYVTVEREPDFTRIAPIRDARTPDFMHMHRQNPPKYVDDGPGDREHDTRDRALHEAEEIYEETKQSTAPLPAAAFSAAVAAVHHADAERETRSDKRRDERRGERRSDYDDRDSKPRDKKSEKERDPVQEEADRAYREIVMARKIASQVIRSRSNSPNRSVVEKYEEEEVEEPVRIVTPPGMDDKKKVGPYDAPNADFQLDHVLEDPLDLRDFRISPTNTVRADAEGPYLKRDPDADRPRPFLNLVRPTPVPSPMPEKQATRSEPATKSKEREERERSSTSDVKSKDEAVDSPTASNVSKGVTWGENETKHFEVESPSEHRDEFVSKSDIEAREIQEEPQPTAKPKSKGWGALRGALMGASAGAVAAAAAAAAAASSSEISKTPEPNEDEKKDAPYEYRGVVVEPESPTQSSSQRNAPPAGPKPSSSSETSRVPGAFDDDIDFTATVAAGLQDSGFDPNIVIDDPSFRRRDSPPGSNDFKPYRAPFAETVSDLGALPSEVSGARGPQGYVLGEVASTPQDWRSVSPPREDETPTKLSKKEQKKRDKERRRSGDMTPLEESSVTRDVVEEPESYFEPSLSKKEQKKRDKLARQNSQGDDITPSVAEEIVEEPESYFETPKKSKKKSKKGSVDDYAEDTSRDRKVSVPVDAFDDLRNDEDEWADTKKSKKKSKRDSDRYDSPSRSVPSSEIASELERSSSKKSKDKAKRKSEQYEPDPTEVSLPASTPSETSREGDFDDSRGTRKSSTRDSGIFNSSDRGDSRSVVSADASHYDDNEPRKSKKKSRSSTKDDFEDSRSVVSAPAGDDYEDSKRSKKKDKDKEKDKKSGGGFFGLFGSKSDIGATNESPKDSKADFEEPKKKKKSKRSSVADSSSTYDDAVSDLSRSMSNGNGDKNGTYDDQDEENGDNYSEKSKTRSRSESSSSKKDSFLGNAGTLGAGVGIAGAAVAFAAQQYQQSKAANAHSRETVEYEQPKSSPNSVLPHEIYDPEITERQFRPSIDPQYGDLLPLPPSNPVSPNVDPIDDLPELPDSRPDTPEPERVTRDKSLGAIRKNVQETPMKSPSQSAVPLNFLMRNRSQPSSPRFVRSSPLQSPATPHEDSLSFPRYRPRPTSWDSTKEYKPLYLVESHRRGSSAPFEMEEALPELPPSQRTSRSSSQLEVGALAQDPLSIDTELASSKPAEELLGSEQSTPKAAYMTRDDHIIDDSIDDKNPMTEPGLASHPEQRPPTPEPKSQFGEHVAEVAAAAGLISTIGYFASSPTHPKTKESSLDELPLVPEQPSPIDPVTKDRSSYLLQSSPMSKKFEEFEAADRDLDSPNRKQKRSRSGSNAMESIQEREATNVFRSPKATSDDIESHREKTMDTLSRSPHEDLASQEKTREVLGSQAEDLQDQDIATPAADEVEPADEFTFTKSKKDKKKDKKKGKGLSRSSTQDDVESPESSKDVAEETTGLAEAQPADNEFFITKSKKDKKKSKGLSRSSAQDHFVIPESSKDIGEETAGPAEVEPADDEFFVPKSKKDKKKGKGLSRSSTQDNFAILESSKAIGEETAGPAKVEPADDELFLTKSKEDKKKDKKKGKAVSASELDERDVAPQQIKEPVPDTIRDVSEESVTPANVEPLDEISTSRSKKNKKKDNRKPVVAREPEVSDDKPQMIEELEQEPTRSLPEDISTPVNHELVDEFVTKKPKKDKKKENRKSVVAWEPEISDSKAQTFEKPEQEPTRSLPDISTPVDHELVDEFVTKKSKKDKKQDKRNSMVTWEPDTSEGVLQIIEPIEQESTQAISEDISTPVADEPVDEFFSTQFKKGKKRDKKAKSIWKPEEEDISQPLSEPTIEQSRGFTDETIIPAEIETLEDFSFTKSKKDKKKDKTRSTSTSAVESERDESEAPALEISRDLVEEPAYILHEPLALESSITEPAGDLTMSQTPEHHEAITEAEVTPEDSRLEPERDGARGLPIGDDFTAFETKKGKKKKGKSMMSWEQEDEAAVPLESLPSESHQDITQDIPEAAQATSEFVATKSKKSKKDKKRRGEFITAWEPEEEPASMPTAPEVEDSQDFEAATFKRGKKKNRKPLKFADDDDDQASSSRQEPEDSSTTQQVKTTEPESILDVPESLSSKPTPMGGPGAWPITPATPWTSGEVRDTSSKEYFPSAEAVHASTVHEPPEDMQHENYFPSAKTVLPIIAAGAALLGEESLKKEPSHSNEELTEDGTRSRTVNLNEPSTLQSDSKPTTDVVTAGYNNEQLSLAKRLQEEFNSGSKKPKKDKKRQSLPPTPAREASRSRTMEEAPDLHPRARSLSIGPTAANNYNDDEVELARQDFTTGSKKSKKDKKKRPGLSHSATQDDTGFDRGVDDSQIAARDFSKHPQDSETWETVPKGDGFAAGYQEDQLSLARQLQAEFGKKSKKDKKRRNTSQTPQEQDSRDDYFGEQSRALISDGMEQEYSIPVAEPSIQDTTRDGLAVGYSEEQLELARQLKEEFGSGSKKIKKDKKDKKRRSTSQTPQEQEPRDDYFGEPVQVARFDEMEQNREVRIPESNPEANPSRDGLAVGYKEEQLELARQLKEEFGSGSKKSKKDKKDKKRGSLLRSNTEDDFSSDVQRDADNGILEAQQLEFAEVSPANEAEDEFALATKKSKDKKDKKRGSLLRSNTEDDFSFDAQPRNTESNNFQAPRDLIETSQINEPGDESTFVTKKSKKDKKSKKRASLPPDTQGDELPSDTFSGPADDEIRSQTIESLGAVPFEEQPSESARQEDDVTFTKTSKKDKKAKKRDSILRSTAEHNLPSETQIEGQDEDQGVVVPSQPEFTPEFSAEPVAVGPEDEFAAFTKKTKKDKKGKKEDSTMPSATDEDMPRGDFGQEVEALHEARDMTSEDIVLEPTQAAPEDDWSVPVKPSKKDKKRQSGTALETYGQRDVEASSRQPEEHQLIPNVLPEAVVEASDDFGFSSKKSKKDKKKRGSLLRSSTFNGTLEEKATEVQPELESREGVEEATATIDPLADDQGDGFEFSSKKSKNDKKKRGSLLRNSTVEETPEEQAKEIEVKSDSQDLDDNATIAALADKHEAGFEYSSKKSKKDKKKRGSLLRSSTFDEALQEQVIEDEVRPESDSQDLGDAVSASLPPLAVVQDDEFEYSSKKSKDKKKRKSSQQTPMLEDLPKEVEEPRQQDDAAISSFTEDVRPSNLENEYRAPEPATTSDEGKPFSEPSNIKTELDAPESIPHGANFEQDTAIDQPEEVLTSGPPDIFHDFAFTTKKSKNDKEKRKDSTKDDSEEASGLSTPLNSIAESKSIVESSVPVVTDETVADDNPDLDALTLSASGQQHEEPADELSSFSVKKSKKDKKRKSSSRTASVGPSGTLLEPILEPEIVTKDRHLPTNDLIEEDRVIEEPLNHPNEESLRQATAEDNIEAPTDERASFSNKKSKKDKKKSKSLSRIQSEEPSDVLILSDPVVEVETGIKESSFPTQSVSREAIAGESTGEPEDLTNLTTKGDIEEPVDEWASFATKKSKKDKKKRKPGLSTPIEPTEEISTFATENSLAEESPRPSLEPAQAEHNVPVVQAEESLPKTFDDDEVLESAEPQIRDSKDLRSSNEEYKEQEATDEAFAFTTKISKKDKKSSKRSSRATSESRAATPGPAIALPIKIAETQTDLPSEQTVSSPVAMECENLGETNHAERYSEQATVDDERKDAFGGNLTRAPSKKDKRKRQATVADICLDDNMDTPTKPPLTSWADEVEEAEIEREIPVIQDIAKDESLSHIASTTESAPADDFFRPTKKGKKGKKRASEPASSVESSRPATSSGTPKDELADEHSNMTILAATGAALAGAALLSKDDESWESSSKSAAATTPQRKLSKKEKKEKKKKSVDLGPTPRDDIFDDPALWEGAEPKAHEEVRHIDDDTGSDGFGFTSRDMDEPVSIHEPYDIREPSPTLEQRRHVEEARPITPTAAASFTPEEFVLTHEKEISLDDRHTTTEDFPEHRYPTTEEQQERQTPQESDHRSSTEEERIAQVPSSGDLSEDDKQHIEDIRISEPHIPGPSRSMVDTPPSDKGISFEEPLPIINEYISTSSRASAEQPPSERSAVFENLLEHSPARPLSTSKYGRTSFSDLPVVHEESEHLSPHPHHDFEGNRDSAFVTGSPIPRHQFTDDHEHVRDSGVHLRDFSPAEKARTHASSTDDALSRLSWPQVDEETETVDLRRSQRSVVEASTGHHHQEKDLSEPHDTHSHESRRPRGDKAIDFYRSQRSTEENSAHHDKAPLTSRDLFPSYKSTEERSIKHHDHDEGTSRNDLPSQHSTEEKHTDLHRVATIHESRKPREDSLVKQRLQRFESPDFQRPVKPKEDKYAELASSQRPRAERPKGMSEAEAGAATAGASLGFAAARKLSQEQRPPSAQSQRSSSNINRLRTPDPKRPDSGASNRSGTPPLRRSDRKLSGDLRSLSQRSKPDLAKEAELAALASSTSASANPTANEGRVRAKDMATDVYDGFGEGRMGSPRSPTRPHSMRRRQSMQVLDLESKVEQLAAENRMLAEAKAQAERTLASTSHASSSLIEKDAEIDSLKRTLDWLQNEVTRLTQVNEGLNSSHIELGRQHNDRYGALESQHAQATRELQEVRDAHDNLSAGMEGIVRNEVQGAVQDKDREIAQLRAELDAAKEQIREMQRQILASKASEVDFLTVRDEDYFDNACQSLCQHVQQWVLRFSKFSDMRACRLSSEINNDKTIDRLDNAILDGSDVDNYLADRIKRRDVFMSMTMNMVWEFIFTRYLFGMDREQRQKLKSLEKTLSEVGPAAAVHHWRATTLTLLSKRDAFIQQREQDTQAVVHAIIETLSEILPPPSHLENQIEEQLTRVMKEAVDLSIEMRTQRAEYMMLPPLLPEYDANGDLASKVSFNAALMNERSGDTVSNEELEEQKAVVRVVLFPLVVKKGDDRGEGDEEIVVCPAQVLVAKPKKSVRVWSGSVQGHSRVSLQSTMPADYGEGSVI
ncbi:hypothetical protein N431DRAFT_476373 [Stipitochalara longipes BDJ]|nr:hypothetical protein N431DRAFT_476373 [Stipitochalara longipes BDJ]